MALNTSEKQKSVGFLRERVKSFARRYPQLSISLLVLIAAGFIALLLVVTRKPPERVEQTTLAPLVEVQRLAHRDIPMVVNGYGTVAPKVSVEIAPQVAGKVVWVNPQFKPGGFIAASKPIIEIDPRDYELVVQQAQAVVAEAEVALDTEKAEAAVAEKEWYQLHPDTEPTSPLVLRQPQIRRAEAALESANARLQTARLNLERSVVSLPLDLRVTAEQVNLGQYVAAGRAVGSGYGIETVEIEVPLDDALLAWFDIPENPLPLNGNSSTNSGSPALVIADFAGAEHSWTGQVKRTTGQVDRASRLVSVVVEVEHPFDRSANRPPLVPGMFVEVQIQGNMLKDAVAVPRNAVREENTIWLVRGGELHIQRLEIRRADKDFAYVTSDLSDGDLVVVSSLDAVTDGMKVRTQLDVQAEQQQSITKDDTKDLEESSQ